MFVYAAAQRGAYSNAHIDEYVSGFSRPGALTAALNYYRANFNWWARPPERLAPIRAPTLVIWGEQDPALGTGLLDGLDRVVPGVEVHRIPTSGHWVQNEAPEEVNQLLIRFLQGSPQVRPAVCSGMP
jgi:pimeloyl-ACP methyl ester carboxylesterase